MRWTTMVVVAVVLGGCGDKAVDSGGDTATGGDGGSADGGGSDGGGSDGGGSDGGDGGDACDDPFPAMCAMGQGLENDAETIDALEILDGTGVVVEQYACASAECCTYSLPAGSYTFAATKGEERLEQSATVENSFACDHDVTYLTYVFDVAR